MHCQTGAILSRCYSASSADVSFVFDEESANPTPDLVVIEPVAAPSLHPSLVQGRPATGFDDPEWDMVDPDEELFD